MKINSILIKAALLILSLTLPFSLHDAVAQSGGQLVFVGKVSNISQQSNSFSVRGIRVRADDATVQALRTGMIVRITGTRTRDYSINASQVTRIRSGQTFSAQGLVLAKNPNARTINFAGMVVSVPSSTRILSVTRKNLSFASLNNGAGATILMALSGDGRVQARQIQLFVPPRISGDLQGSSASKYWLMLDEGLLFGDSATRIMSKNKPMTFRNLIPGQKVSVKVFRQGSSFYATGVDVLSADKVRLTGIVQNLNPANKTFQLQGFTVQWSGATAVSSWQSGATDSVQLSNGQFVKVTGSQKGNLSIVATTVQTQPSNRIEVRGILQAINSSSITVDGTSFGVSSSTKVEDRNSLPISLSALKAGNVVNVKGVKNSDNTLRANQIELKNDVADSDSEDIEVTGIVDSKTANSISVSGITIQIVASTRIRGDVSKGRAVEAKARSQGSNWIGIEIKQVDAGPIDDGDDNGNDDNGNDDNGNDDNGNDDNGNDDNGNDDNGNDDNGNDDNGNDDNGNDDNGNDDNGNDDNGNDDNGNDDNGNDDNGNGGLSE